MVPHAVECMGCHTLYGYNWRVDGALDWLCPDCRRAIEEFQDREERAPLKAHVRHLGHRLVDWVCGLLPGEDAKAADQAVDGERDWPHRARSP